MLFGRKYVQTFSLKHCNHCNLAEDTGGGLSNGVAVSPPDIAGRLPMALDPGDEVRSKNRPRQKRRADSVTAECGEDGVKNIKDILNCADMQLQASKEFAERLAKRRCVHN